MQGIHNESEDIDYFFAAPNQALSGDISPLLYLIRKELEYQYGNESAVPGSISIQCRILTSIGIMDGIELLSRIWSGKPFEGRIRAFLVDIMKLGEPEAIALNQFRHALSHGWRLTGRRQKDMKKFAFILDDDPALTASIVETFPGSNEYRVSIWCLKELFLTAVSTLKTTIETDSQVRANFFSFFLNYGELRVSL